MSVASFIESLERLHVDDSYTLAHRDAIVPSLKLQFGREDQRIVVEQLLRLTLNDEFECGRHGHYIDDTQAPNVSRLLEVTPTLLFPVDAGRQGEVRTVFMMALQLARDKGAALRVDDSSLVALIRANEKHLEAA